MSTKIIFFFSLGWDDTYAVFKTTFATGPYALCKHTGPDIFHFVVFFLSFLAFLIFFSRVFSAFCVGFILIGEIFLIFGTLFSIFFLGPVCGIEQFILAYVSIFWVLRQFSSLGYLLGLRGYHGGGFLN